MKRATVIIPMYNSAKYIEECLSSVDTSLAEVICINDGSTDNTLKLASKFPVKIINNNFNLGQGVCRNLGLMATNTDYVMFMDSDDYHCPDTVAEMLEAVDGHTYAVCGTRTFGKFYRDYGSLRISGQNVLEHNTSLLTPVVCWNKIYRTDSIKNKDLWFAPIIPEDNIFWFCYSCANFCVWGNYIQKPLYNYRIVENGSFGMQGKNTNPRYDTIAAFFMMYDFLNDNGYQKHIKFLFESYFTNFIRHYAHITGKSHGLILDRVCAELIVRGITPSTIPALSKEIQEIFDKSYKI